MSMTQGETDQYLHHRLAVAGGQEGIRFDSTAVKEIFQYSRGTPRLVNAVGDKALLAGYVYQTATIDGNIVRLAINELREAG
jgi:general secretion pathway protein A